MRRILPIILLGIFTPAWLLCQNIYLTQGTDGSDAAAFTGVVWNQGGQQLWVAPEAPHTDAMLLATDPWSDNHEVILFSLAQSFDPGKLNPDVPGQLLWNYGQTALFRVSHENFVTLREKIHGVVKRVPRQTAQTPKTVIPAVDTNQLVYEIVDLVDTAKIMATIRRLEAFKTRKAMTDSAYAASEWIGQQFEDMGYQIEYQNFNIYGSPSSPNVIATKTGTAYPDKYVVIGGHYDSYTYFGNAPGADDNASGTAGVIEAARILADYPTECSIIFCAFSGEEYGLFGSEAFVARCKQQEMNILGYFNLDMIGYRHPGDDIHTDMIYPLSAKPLADYYKEIAAIFVPELGVFDGFLTGGDSDHTSFNNHGYMGIFPFEDDQNYSPYIHSAQDVTGLSVNSAEMAGMLTQASLAGVSSMGGVFTYASAGEADGSTSLRLIPNPATDKVRIVAPGMKSDIHVQVVAPDGRTVIATRLQGADKVLSVAHLSRGIYIVRLTDGTVAAESKMMKW